jgi:hypothetical protein
MSDSSLLKENEFSFEVMQSSVSPFKTRLKGMPQQLLLCVLTIRKGTTITS